MEKEAAMLHRIVIITDGCSSRIVPGHIVVGPDDTILFSAIGSDVRLFFPNPGIFVGAGNLEDLIPKTKTLQVTVTSRTPGSYVYAAYCAGPGRFATGGSDGEIIIQT